MTKLKSGTNAFQKSTTGVTAGSTSPAPASVGGSSYWYSGAAAGTADYQYWDLDGSGAWRFRRLVYVDTASTTDLDLVVFRSGVDAAANLTIRIQGTDKLRIVPSGGSTSFWTSTATFPHDGWYELEGYGNAVDGTGRVRLTTLTGTTVIDTGDGTANNVGGALISGMAIPQGGVAHTGVRLGKASSGTGYTGKVAWDEDEVHTGTDATQAFIGSYAATGTSGDAYPTGAASGGFTRVGTATTDGAALADSDDTTYLESATLTATVQTLRVAVQAMTSRTGLAVTFRMRRGGSGTFTAVPRLMQGTTSRGALAAVTVTDTWADYTLTLTAAQVAAITDWTNLYVEVDCTT